jgi:tRNA threonylcarbamoyladenosine biosynthesis protein TsaB
VLLAIDTATQNASVALYDAQQVWAERTWFSERNHTVEVMPAIAEMLAGLSLAPAALKGVAVAVGPGSFTGMRVGLSAAKGFGLALNIPVIGIPTLDVVAQPFADGRLPVCAVVHAGRGRFCAAMYGRQRGKWARLSDFRLASPAELPAGIAERTLFCGELDDEARQAVQSALGDKALFASPAQSVRRAAVLAELAWERAVAGRGDDLALLAPIYIH